MLGGEGGGRREVYSLAHLTHLALLMGAVTRADRAVHKTVHKHSTVVPQ